MSGVDILPIPLSLPPLDSWEITNTLYRYIFSTSTFFYYSQWKGSAGRFHTSWAMPPTIWLTSCKSLYHTGWKKPYFFVFILIHDMSPNAQKFLLWSTLSLTAYTFLSFLCWFQVCVVDLKRGKIQNCQFTYLKNYPYSYNKFNIFFCLKPYAIFAMDKGILYMLVTLSL